MVFGNLISLKYSVPSFLINALYCFYRCYYLALSYASNKQWLEVVALSRRAQEYVSQSQEVLTADKKQVCSYISAWDLKRCLFHASTTKVTFLPCCKPGFLAVRQCSPSFHTNFPCQPSWDMHSHKNRGPAILLKMNWDITMDTNVFMNVL